MSKTRPNHQSRLFDYARETLVLILAGGRGTRLHELTDWRAKPAVYFGGSWRIIDFTLSNCINSRMLKIAVITQYQAHSLLRHLQHGWSFLSYERGNFVDMLPARQQIDETTWYRGTADAVWQNVAVMQTHYRPKYVVILAGDHIYKMNYLQMLQDHIDSGALCTVGCIEVKRKEAQQFGVMAVNEKLKIRDFVEKPDDPPAMPDKPDNALASMGIYVFDAAYLYDVLARQVANPDTRHDFGKDIIPQALADGVLYAHPFERSCMGRNTDGYIYWRDVGTVDSYWQANIDLTSETPQLDIFDDSWPIRGIAKQDLPSKFFYADKERHVLDNSLIGAGCVITNASIRSSVLFDRVRVGNDTHIENAVILPQVAIGRDCSLRNCILDRKVTIPDRTTIGADEEADRARFRVSEKGIVLLGRSMMDEYGNPGTYL